MLVVGVPNLWAALLHLRRSDYAGPASLASGLLLAIFVLVELAMLRSFAGRQALYLAVAVAIMLATLPWLRPWKEWRDAVRAMPPPVQARPAGRTA